MNFLVAEEERSLLLGLVFVGGGLFFVCLGFFGGCVGSARCGGLCRDDAPVVDTLWWFFLCCAELCDVRRGEWVDSRGSACVPRSHPTASQRSQRETGVSVLLGQILIG